MSRHYDTTLHFVRESDQATLDISGRQLWNSTVILDSATRLPQPRTATTSSYRNGGDDGGYGTSGTYDPRPFDVLFTIRERDSNAKSLLELGVDLASFFRLHDDDNWLEKYTCVVSSGDKHNFQYQLRHGHIVTPLNTPMEGTPSHANGSVGLLFGDPYVYAFGSSGDATASIVRFMLTPSGAIGTTRRGRRWTLNGVVWTTTGTIWDFPQDGGTGTPVTVRFTTENTVPAEFTISGQATNPKITNTTNGSSFQYFSTVSDGQTLSVSSDGVVLLQGLPAPGTWSDTLLTASNGLNTFIYEADNPNANSVARVTLLGAI